MSVKDAPFNMIRAGMTGCGKTFYLLNFIEKNYMNQFDYIMMTLWSFNNSYNPTIGKYEQIIQRKYK